MNNLKISENPTSNEIGTIMVTKMVSTEIAKMGTRLLETYLLEYCEVNKVKEAELGSLLEVGYFPFDNSLMVVNVEDRHDVKIGVKWRLKPEKKCYTVAFEVFGSFTEEQSKYPKTFNLTYNGRGS